MLISTIWVLGTAKSFQELLRLNFGCDHPEFFWDT